MSKIKHKFLQTQQTRNKGATKDHLVQPLILWLGTQICYTFFPQIVPDRSVFPRESRVPHLLPKILTTFPIILSLYITQGRSQAGEKKFQPLLSLPATSLLLN